MANPNATPANANYLAKQTGLSPAVTMAWLQNEGQSVPNPTNPLNIIAGGTPGQTGTNGGFGTYASTTAGLDAAAWLLKNNSAYTPILASTSSTPLAQAQAIQNSPWAKGHYSYSGIVNSLAAAEKQMLPSGNTSPSTTPSSNLLDIPNGTVIGDAEITTMLAAIQALPNSNLGPSQSTLATILAKYKGQTWNASTQAALTADVQSATPANSPFYSGFGSVLGVELPQVAGLNDLAGIAPAIAAGFGNIPFYIAIIFGGILVIGGVYLIYKDTSSSGGGSNTVIQKTVPIVYRGAE
jgi:hypothetical protein